jgi:WD40 repeat protein
MRAASIQAGVALALILSCQGPQGATGQRSCQQPFAASPKGGAVKYGAPPDRTWRFRYPPYGPHLAAVSSSGDLIASGVIARVEQEIRPVYGVALWDTRTGKQVRVLEKPPTPPSAISWSLAFSLDGEHLASGNAGGNVTLWNLKTGAVEHTLQVSTNRVVEQLAFAPNGKTLAAGTNSGDVQLWNVSTGHLERTLKGLVFALNAISFSPDGTLVAAGSGVNVAAFTPDILHLKRGVLKNGEGGLTREIGELRVWDLRTGKLLWSDSGGADHFVYAVAFSPDSKQLVSGGARLRGWAAPTGAPQWTQKNRPSPSPANVLGPVLSVAFAPQGGLLATTSSRNVRTRLGGYAPTDDLELWDAATGRLLKTLASEKDINARLVAFTQDGGLLWCGEGDKEVNARVWHGTGK